VNSSIGDPDMSPTSRRLKYLLYQVQPVIGKYIFNLFYILQICVTKVKNYKFYFIYLQLIIRYFCNKYTIKEQLFFHQKKKKSYYLPQFKTSIDLVAVTIHH
jgi:hypothetical protein